VPSAITADLIENQKLIHASKVSTVPLFARPLTDFLDTVIVNDAVLYHSANAVQQANPDELAFRDMLLISFSSAR